MSIDDSVARGRRCLTQLRDHHKIVRWPPGHVGGSYAGAGPLLIEQLPEDAVLRHVEDYPPIPVSTGAQGLILTTDRGSGIIATSDARFREQLFSTLQACLGLSLREIGDGEIDF